MDGSASPFVDLINAVGVMEQDSVREFIRIKRTIRVTQAMAKLPSNPTEGSAGRIRCRRPPVFNRHPKSIQLDFSRVSYVDEVSRARSFGLVSDLGKARAINKCLGSSLQNAVGIDDFSILNEEGLRYRDEFVKHKLLDAMGDLYLLGRPILGEFEGHKSGHELNNKLVRALLRCEDAWEVIDSADGRRSREQPLVQPAIWPDPTPAPSARHASVSACRRGLRQSIIRSPWPFAPASLLPPRVTRISAPPM